MKPWVSVTLHYNHPDAPRYGDIHYRITSPEEEWSGWADSEEEALIIASSLRKDIERKLYPLPRNGE